MNVTPKRPENGTPKRAENDAPKPAENAEGKADRNWVERRLSLDARDPTPFEDAANFWRASSQAATIVMCVLMLGVLLYLARALLLPLLCALSVGLTSARWLAAASAMAFRPGSARLTLVVLHHRRRERRRGHAGRPGHRH